MGQLPAVDVARFWREGYLTVKGIFSPTEVEELRAAAYRELEEAEAGGHAATAWHIRFARGDLLSKRHLRHVVLDERILHIAEQILGTRPVYFGDSNFEIAGDASQQWKTPKGGHWHKDNRWNDRTDPNGLDWQGRYPVIRFGLYLQDHSRHSGSVAVRVGSHEFPNLSSGKAVFASPAAGDMVAWCLRTTHSGHSVRCRLMPDTKLPVKVEYRLPQWLCVPHEMPRAALFLTYGAPGEHMRRYVEEFAGRADNAEHLQCSRFDATVWELIRRSNLEILRPTPEYGTRP